MKKFDTPRMERINLVRQNIMAVSPCNTNYCNDYTCDECQIDFTCYSLSPCTRYHCNSYLCPYYQA